MSDYNEIDGVQYEEDKGNPYPSALETMVKHRDGKIVLQEILRRCGILEVGQDDGRRSLGLQLLQEIKAISSVDAAGILFGERRRV
jgi:hypothetical protein